ncbi:MAG: type VI secretion system baseplate subunit TssK [Gammaproteobacteria bacterium]|nr:type VI secretion system baseplate subunit TssK [Gammaproteobacteria bacterium]
MKLPSVPQAAAWRDGLVLRPAHFQQTDDRAATLSHLAALAAEPWPWGFVSVAVDETALASARLHVRCEGILPNGVAFAERGLSRALPPAENAAQRNYHVAVDDNGAFTLSAGDEAPADRTLPVARLVFQSGVWAELSEWSPPAYLLGPQHPMRTDIAHQLGALAALGAGFMTTLRLPGAEDRPAARVLGQVAAALSQGVGVMEALLAAPTVSPGRLGIEALRLALGVRAAAGEFEQLDVVWDPADQRGSMRRLLFAAESTAAGIGLPFRASLFRATDDPDILLVEGMPQDVLLLAVEASRPADLIAARAWLEGAALAAPERIQEAFGRRVAGCGRLPVERDPRLGVSSGPLLALYQVERDAAWRGQSTSLALGSKTPPPPNTSFSIFVPEGQVDVAGAGRLASPRGAFPAASWAGGSGGAERS